MALPKLYPNLLFEMNRRGDTQEDLSRLLNITPLSIYNKLTGKREWKISEIEKLCKRYNKSFLELFKRD